MKEKLKTFFEKVDSLSERLLMWQYFGYELIFKLFNKKPHPILYADLDHYEAKFGDPENYNFSDPYVDKFKQKTTVKEQ